MPVLELLTDPALNGGWNFTAIAFYAAVTGLAVVAWLERKL